jgi:hypothetical protein
MTFYVQTRAFLVLGEVYSDLQTSLADERIPEGYKVTKKNLSQLASLLGVRFPMGLTCRLKGFIWPHFRVLSDITRRWERLHLTSCSVS